MEAVRTTISALGQSRLAQGRALDRGPGEAAEAQRGAVDFGRQLLERVGQADSLIANAETQATRLANDEGDAIETIIAVSKADLALREVTTLRNRALEAYQEIMRLPI